MSARNTIALLVALSTLSLLVGCGNSNSPAAVAPPSGAFSASSLSGTYVFSFSGADISASSLAASVSYFAAVGTLTASNGSLTGTMDVIDPELGAALNIPAVLTAQTLTGSYTITKDGRGKGTIQITYSGTHISFGIDFVLTSSSHGLITRFDTNGTGSGTLDLQDSTLTQSALTSYAFSLSGVDNGQVNPFTTAGAFTLGGTTSISAGLEDFNDDMNSTTNLPLTGSVTLGSGGAAGSALLTGTGSPYSTLTFDVWPIDATHMKLIEVDGFEFIEGDAFTQQTTISSGSLVYTMTGLDVGNSDSLLSSGGFFSYDGSSAVSGGYEDINDGGSIGSSQTVSGTMTPSGGGRYDLSLSGFYNSTAGAGTYAFAAYPSSGGVLLMEVDNSGVSGGTALPQSAQTFASAQGYGLNLTGANSNGEVDDIAEFTATSGTVSNCSSGGTLSDGLIDENDEGTLGPGLALGSNGTYCFDSGSTGRGELAYPDSGTFIGTLNLDFYVANSSTILFIDVDSEAQTGVGSFQLQSPPSSSSAIATTQVHASALKAAAAARARKRQK